MPRDAEPKPAENLIGNIPFGFTVQAIEEEAIKMRNELVEINSYLSGEKVDEGGRKFIEGRKTKIEKFLTVSAVEMIQNFQTIYDFIIQQEKQGLKKDEIIRKIRLEKSEFAQVISSYPYIEAQPWGYRLHQGLIAQGLKDILE